MTDTRQSLADRITAYLSGGGLFNPELADHNAVRDLLIECRSDHAAQPESKPQKLSQENVDAIFKALEDAPTMSWRYYVAEAFYEAYANGW